MVLFIVVAIIAPKSEQSQTESEGCSAGKKVWSIGSSIESSAANASNHAQARALLGSSSLVVPDLIDHSSGIERRGG